MHHDNFELRGHVTIEKHNPDGTRTVLYDDHNLVVSNGKALAASRLFYVNNGNADEFPAISQMSVGAGNVAPDPGQTSLQNLLATKGFDGFPARSNNTTTVTSTFNPGEGTGNWQEASLSAFTGTVSIMFSRVTFTAIPKGAGDTISITWGVTAN